MTEHLCVCCQRRQYEWPHVCESCRRRMGYELAELVDLVPRLLEPEPADRPARLHPLLDHEGQVVLRHGEPVYVVGVPAGPVTGAPNGARVSGGDAEPPLPIRVDPTDLTLAAWSLDPLRTPRRRPDAVADAYHDQTGVQPVAVVLDGWARDWAQIRAEHLPPPTVAALAGWLADRIDWACEHHGAVEEFARELSATIRAVRRNLGITQPPTLAWGVVCKRCDLVNTIRLMPGGDYECGNEDCRLVLTVDEYIDHVKRSGELNGQRLTHG